MEYLVAFDRDLDESERTSVALLLTSDGNALTVGSKQIHITGSAEMVIAGERGNIQFSTNLKERTKILFYSQDNYSTASGNGYIIGAIYMLFKYMYRLNSM